MSNRFKNTLYTLGDYKRIGRHIRYITNEDGTLFSGHYRTKIRPEDLPEWYLYGRYYKRFGYMSTKGITDMLYIHHRGDRPGAQRLREVPRLERAGVGQ